MRLAEVAVTEKMKQNSKVPKIALRSKTSPNIAVPGVEQSASSETAQDGGSGDKVDVRAANSFTSSTSSIATSSSNSSTSTITGSLGDISENPDEATSPQRKLQQQRLQQRRRRRQHRLSQHHHDHRSRSLTPTTARKLADLDHSPTSPKRVSRDGGGRSSTNKWRQRQDAEGNPGVKADSLFSRDKIKSGQVIKNADRTVEGKHDSRLPRATSHENPVYVRQNRYASEVRELGSVGYSLRNTRTSTVSATSTPGYVSNTGGQEGPESSSQTYACVEPKHQTDQKLMSSDHNQHQDIQRSSRHRPDQGHKPLHGILKDSSNSGPAHIYHQTGNRHHYGDPSGLARDNQHYQSSQHPSQGTNIGSRAELHYQQTCGSLPTSSRSATPESAYNYASFPAHAKTSTHAQHNMLYGEVPGNWGSVPRKTESDSGFSIGSNDHTDNNYAVINYKRSNQRKADVAKKYAAVGHIYQPPRPDSVPASSHRGSPDSFYSVIRPGSVPPQHFSDTEGGRCYRGSRAGDVQVGYESGSAVLGLRGTGQLHRGNDPRNYETASDYASGSSSSLRVTSVDKQSRNGRGKRPIPRRNTVSTTASKKKIYEQETEKKREAFMELLAQRYPQYADKIQGVESPVDTQPPQQEKPSRSRDGQRRRTSVVTYNPNQATNVLEYDDLGTMSDLELPSFQRSGFMRTSLPIVRSASTSLERPLGLVFLVYGDQTKKSMLPNEITTLDTVRALFVRAFPDLTLDMLENPRKKIYLLDPATNIYFQLEDLMDIKDRSVLKIHETDSDQPQKVKEKQEVRGRTVQMPASRPPHSQQAYGELPLGHQGSQSLPPQAAQNYPEIMQEQHSLWEFERRSRSRTPELAERPRSLSAGASSRQRFSHSPDRLPTPERAPLNPIPENRQLLEGYREQGNYYETVGPGTYRGQYPSGIFESPVPYQGYPPSSQIPQQQTYIARSTRAPSIAHPQRAVAPGHDIRDSSRGNNANRHSLAFAPMSVSQAATVEGGLHSQNFRIPPTERDGPDLSRSATPANDTTRNRIEKMEQQLANLTAWVHCQKDGTRRESIPQSLGSTTSDGSDTLPASSSSKHKGETPPLSTIVSLTDYVHLQGLSDIHDGSSNQRSSGLSSRESTPISAHKEISAKLAQLKSDLHILRRQQQLNMEAMRDEFSATTAKIKKILLSTPGAENQVNFYKRNEASFAKRNYLNDKGQVEKELSDLEASVEELRTDVISRQCRVNTSDVEAMALLLSNITRSLADLKAQFPEIHSLMKDVMDIEMRVVVSEEKFLKEEPTDIEHSLKRCKKITGTLYTLKRLASVQDHRAPHVPNMAATTDASLPDKKKALLDNIRALVPDHEQRVKEMEAAEASRERKKKINSQQEALKFGKSLEIASKNLRPPSLTDVRGGYEDMEVDKEYRTDRGGQFDEGKSVVPTKLAVLSATTVSSKLPTSTASSSVKTSLPLASTAVKPLDKPTATVSAMTAGVSDTITMMATTTAGKESTLTIMKNVSMSLTKTTDCLTNTGLGKSEPLTQSIKVGTSSPNRKDATVYTYQVNGPVNTVYPVPSPTFKTENMEGSSSMVLELKDKLTEVYSHISNQETSSGVLNTPVDLQLTFKADSSTRGMLSGADQHVTTTDRDTTSSPNNQNEHADSKEKADMATLRQAARSAFFSSLNSPPDSPSLSSPNRNSAGLEPGPNISPTHQVLNVRQGTSINSLHSDSTGSKSSTSSGFATVAPSEMGSLKPIDSKLPSSPQHSGIPHSKSPSHDSHTGSDSGTKQKKVPPPPPPRKDSRPTSASISPVSGGPLDFSMQQSRDMPRFVGGILGQHRHSGGPLFSTPKPVPQQKPASRYEQDIASGIYANMNRPDVQNQKSCPQQMISEANIPINASSVQTNTSYESMSIPPPPSVTIALDREERGSSSESTSSSSSGASMGSQQSVVSVIRSSPISDKGSSKPKPDPPKRQSSLLAKLTGSKESKINNGKARANGVDL